MPYICSYPSYMETIGSIHNMRILRVMVTGTPLSWYYCTHVHNVPFLF